jgi:hypothetical protein
VFDDTAFKNYGVCETLRDEVGKIDGGVDAKGRECCARIDARGNRGLGEDAEIGDYIFEPWCRGQEFVKPLTGRTLGVFVAVIN